MKKLNLLKIVGFLFIAGSISIAQAEVHVSSNTDALNTFSSGDSESGVQIYSNVAALQAQQNLSSENSGLRRLSSGNRVSMSAAACNEAARKAMNNEELSLAEKALFPTCEICAEAVNDIIVDLCQPQRNIVRDDGAIQEVAEVPAEIIEEDVPPQEVAEVPADLVEEDVPPQEVVTISEETDAVYPDSEPVSVPTTVVGVTEQPTVEKVKTAPETPLVEAVAPATDLFSPQFVEGGKCSLDKSGKNGNNGSWFLGLFLIGMSFLKLRKKA